MFSDPFYSTFSYSKICCVSTYIEAQLGALQSSTDEDNDDETVNGNLLFSEACSVVCERV